MTFGALLDDVLRYNIALTVANDNLQCSDPSIAVSCDREGLISRSDTALHNQDWTENVMGKVSDWIDLDNKETSIR